MALRLVSYHEKVKDPGPGVETATLFVKRERSMAKAGRAKTSYLRRPPVWADTLIRARQPANSGARVRSHAGFCAFEPASKAISNATPPMERQEP